MNIYDMHCHVDLMGNMEEFSSIALQEKINLLAMTTTPKAFELEKKKLEVYPNVRVSLGLHPQLVQDRYKEIVLVEKHIHTTKFVGEIGLDFNKQFYFSKDRQIEVFTQIIKWCKQSPQKVLSIHSVRADKTVLDILEKYNCSSDNSCILHWYSGPLKQLNRAIEMGCFFSVNEYMVNSPNGRSVIQKIPSNRLLLESDAPFISKVATVHQLKLMLNNTIREIVLIKEKDVSLVITKTSHQLFESL